MCDLISHMAQEYKFTLVIAHSVREANHIHIVASHSTKNDLGKQITINMDRNREKHTDTEETMQSILHCFLLPIMWALEEGKAVI